MPGTGQNHSLRRRQLRTDYALGRGKGAEMSEETQAAKAEEAAEAKTFTQEQVDRIVQERVARVKSTPPSDYDELKAKAAKYDEAQEAAKSDLQRATEEAGKWKAEYEALKAEKDRAQAVREAAKEHGVDADLLAKMAGDVDENARFLKERAEARGKYPSIGDDGEAKPSAKPKAVPVVF